MLEQTIAEAFEMGLKIIIAQSNRGYLIDLERNGIRVATSVSVDLKIAIEKAVTKVDREDYAERIQ